MKTIKYFYSPETFTEVISYDDPYCSRLISKTRNPRITVCGIYDDETNTLSFGVSRCSSKDVFVKGVGANLALSRAESNPILTFRLRKGEKYSPMFYDISKLLTERYLSGSYKL